MFARGLDCTELSVLKQWELLCSLWGLEGREEERQIKRDWLGERQRERLLEGIWHVLAVVTQKLNLCFRIEIDFSSLHPHLTF